MVGLLKAGPLTIGNVSMSIDTLPDASTSVNMFRMVIAPVPSFGADLGATLPEPAATCCAGAGAVAIAESEAEQLAAVLKALADPVRLRLLSIVASAPGREACACDLPASVGRSQPTVSHHLSQLVAVGILDREQRGKWAWFRLRPAVVDAVCAAIGACCAPGGPD